MITLTNESTRPPRWLASMIWVLLLLRSLALENLPAENAPLAGELYWPTPRAWETVAPTEAGMETARLEEALAFAKERHSSGVVVVRGGRIVAERYWRGWTSETASDMCSAQKSISSTLVGIAIDSGIIKGVDESTSDFLTEWKGTPKEQITLRHLLSMASGLYSSRRSDLWRGLRAADQTTYALRLPQAHPPGTSWAYNNPVYGLLNTLLERATGKTRDQFARERLFEPLGMTHSKCEWITLSPRWGLKHHGIRSSCRDMARFGLLILRGGRWQDRQIVSEAYVRDATRPSQNLNPAYGYLFWLNGSQTHRLPYEDNLREGMLFPGCPPDTIAALGAKDSKIYVVPSLDLVVTRLGERATENVSLAPSEFDSPFLSRICDAVRVRKSATVGP